MVGPRVGGGLPGGARSQARLEESVFKVTGRRQAAGFARPEEALAFLASVAGGPGRVIFSNPLSGPSREALARSGARVMELPVPEAFDAANPSPFKGDIDTRALEASIRDHGPRNVAAAVIALTSEAPGGQPVSLRNLRDAADVCAHYRVPLVVEARRLAENAALVRRSERGHSSRPPVEIAREALSHGRACVVGCPLGGPAGALCFDDEGWARGVAEALRDAAAGPAPSWRDVEVLAIGLEESLEEGHMEHRLLAAGRLAAGLRQAGAAIVEPPGAHAVFVDAAAFLPHVSRDAFPAASLLAGLYQAAGIRGAWVRCSRPGQDGGDGPAAPKAAPLELVRLALPPRSVTFAQLDLVVEVFADLARRREKLRGLKPAPGGAGGVAGARVESAAFRAP